MPKSTRGNEPLSSYASATKNKKMEKIEGQANYSFDILAMVSGQVFRLVRKRNGRIVLIAAVYSQALSFC